METTQTLHEFVVSLMTDVDLRAAYELDPTGTLESVGLCDVVPGDVADVIPLVVDSVPLAGLTDLGAVESLGLGSVSLSPTSVVGQVQTVANQFTAGVYSTDVDVDLAGLGAVSVDPNGVEVGVSSTLPVLGLDNGLSVDLSGVHDLADSLDSAVLGTAGGVDTVDGVLGTADFAATTVTSTVAGTTGLVGTGDLGSVTDLTNVTDLADLGTITDLGNVADLGNVTDLGNVADLDGTVGSVTGTVSGVTGTVDGTLGTVGLDGVTDTVGGVTDVTGTVGVTGAVESTVGSVTGLVGGTADLGGTTDLLTDGLL
ncbi:IniB N-terminal domain-containing protein [Plantactinospora sp. WMMB782]|uniref:IniB N-terminal domain-containing protein n=1 Tax=Plantactinospora sp. WMMB782 TaxID=3404121 RepID=UPI003B94DED2